MDPVVYRSLTSDRWEVFMKNHENLPDLEVFLSLPDGESLDSISEESEADIPVPDRLLPKWKSRLLVEKLKLSQKIGLLLYLNEEGLLSEGGKERLLYLQKSASEEALIAGIKWRTRLSKERKLVSDFRHQLRELNRRPQSKRFRRTETSRIGVGYRDKGTLPDISERARRRSTEESWINLDDLPESFLTIMFSDLYQFVEENWFDLGSFTRFLQDEGKRPEVIKLLNSL